MSSPNCVSAVEEKKKAVGAVLEDRGSELKMVTENTLFIDKMPEPPILLEKFLVIASAPDCKCSVTATSTLDASVIAIATHACKGHEERIKQLTALACRQVTLMVNRYVLLPHLGPVSVFATQEAAKSSEASNVHSNHRKENQ